MVVLTLLIPVVACRRSSVPNYGLQIAQRVDHTGSDADSLAREPMIAELPNGALFVAGYGGRNPLNTPKLWKSLDHGASWQRVAVGGADAAIGNSDTDLAVAPDGTLYFVNMGFEVTKDSFAGTHVTIGVSRDSGVTWKWTMLTRKRMSDRPWVDVAPDGTAHVVWNDGTAVYHVMTQDRGETWQSMPAIGERGGSSHLAVGPKGEVAVRVVPISASGGTYTAGVDFIMVSTDRGLHWSKNTPPGQRDWGPMDQQGLTPRWVEPLAWDGDDHLYLLWTESDGVWLGRSADAGESWSKWRIQASNDICCYPYLVARGQGELAATWSCGLSDKLRFQVSRIDVRSGDGPPKVVFSEPQQLDIWERDTPTDPLTRRTAGEYFAVAFLAENELAVVTPVQNKDANRMGFTFWGVRPR